MKSKVINFLSNMIKVATGTLQAQIITGIVATTIVVGGAVGGVMIYKNSIAENEKKYAVNDTETNKEEVKDIEETESNSNLDTITNEGSSSESASKDDSTATTNNNSANNGSGTSTTNNGSSNNSESTSPSNNGSNNNGTQPQPTQPQPTQPQQPTYTVGIDSGLTSQLRQSLSTGQGYRGSKGSEFQSVCTAIAKGTSSASSLNGKSWKEDLSIIALGLSGMGTITVSSATSNQFTIGKDANVGTIIGRGLPNADYTDMVAYRNADGTYTITTLAVKMLIKEGV